jgi:hypothetical protein
MERTHGLVLVLALALGASDATAVDRCSARVNPKTGAVEVGAAGLRGTVTWSGSPDGRGVAFVDADRCVAEGRARRCHLGAPGTLAAITPPAECRVCVHDDGATPCCAFLKGCTPGPRLRDASFAAGDPRICQGIGAADPSCGPVGVWERTDGLVRLGYVTQPDLLVLGADGSADLTARGPGGALRCSKGLYSKGTGSEIVLDGDTFAARVLRFRLPDGDTMLLTTAAGTELAFTRHEAIPADLRCGELRIVGRVDGVPIPDGTGLGFDGGLLRYTGLDGLEVAVDPTTGAVGVPQDLPGRVLTAEGATLWMQDDARTTLTRVAPDGAVLDTVAMPGTPALIAGGAAADPSGGSLFVATTTSTGNAHPLLTIRTAAEPDTVVVAADAEQDFGGLAFDGTKLWAITRDRHIVRLDPAGGRVVETFAPLPGRMAVSALAMVNGDLVALGMDLDTDPRAGVILRLQP